MNRPSLCALAIWFTSTALPTSAADVADPHNRYNVLLICIDDLRPELGCYGAPLAQTPHLDQFARSALRFDRHYVQVPTCGASRYALLTGRSPARSGVTASNSAFYAGPSQLSQEPTEDAQSLPELFRRSGYRTVGIGKISHTADGKVYGYDGSGEGQPEMPQAWDRMFAPLGPWGRGWGIFFAYADGKHREDGGGHKDLMQFTVESDDQLPDGLLAEAAVDQLQELASSEQPFFLSVGFFKPHLPWVAPQEDWQTVSAAASDLPPQRRRGATNYWHASGEFYKYDFPFEKSNPLSDEATRMARTAYRASTRYVDRQVGKVLRALTETGADNDTIVVVWGDHGWHLGDQQIWGKHTPLERAVRSALLIRVPGAPAGAVSDSLAETLDIYPTLVDYCAPTITGTRWPLDGRTLRPVLQNPTAAVRETAISYWREAVSVRTLDRRYIARHTGNTLADVEVYDMTDSEDGELVEEPLPEAIRQQLLAP